jgi:3D (Asp-Asp-Asp) domain-containing protein
MMETMRQRYVTQRGRRPRPASTRAWRRRAFLSAELWAITLVFVLTPLWGERSQEQLAMAWPLQIVAAGVAGPDGLAHAADPELSSVIVTESALEPDEIWRGEQRYARVSNTGANGLRVRSGPGAEHPATLILKEGAVVRVVEIVADRRRERWAQIVGGDGQEVGGWTSAAFLTPLAKSEPVPGRDVPAEAIVLGRILPVKVTAYTYQVPGNGAHGWITKSGDVVAWGLVAVDPKVIPLGSKLTIDGYDQLFIASDTGYGVIGNHVDIFFYDWWSAIRFGVQQRDVIVYE